MDNEEALASEVGARPQDAYKKRMYPVVGALRANGGAMNGNDGQAGERRLYRLCRGG
jgi:hypothetical protein